MKLSFSPTPAQLSALKTAVFLAALWPLARLVYGALALKFIKTPVNFTIMGI